MGAVLPGAASSPAAGLDAASEVVAESRTGVIEGNVVMRETPARRRADRYPGGAPAQPARVQPIPAVVYLKGAVGERGGGATRLRLAQKDTTFQPAVLVVRVGTTVEFPNGDPFFHNVFSYSGAARFDLGRYPQGESKSVRFEKVGVVRIYCEVHETMRSAVIVSENDYYAVVGSDGSFSIQSVPPGRHELEVWHPDLGSKTVDVTVESGRASRLTIELS